jgi:hypothetical protein
LMAARFTLIFINWHNTLRIFLNNGYQQKGYILIIYGKNSQFA